MFRNRFSLYQYKTKYSFFLLTMIVFLVIVQPLHGQEEIRKSVVRIHTIQRLPDPFKPWTKLTPNEIAGTGVVIGGKRILTNAHVVAYASQIYIQPYQSSDKIEARVVNLATGIDLAVLQLEDEEFFDTHSPLPMAEKLPEPRDTINVFGYPIGGTEISVTKGIVSRIGFHPYYYETLGLRIQVDAALNAGNSGGPALSNGEIVGIVFSHIKEADNIGYIIPIEEIKLFLQDITDGRYDGKPMIFDELQTLDNEALRAMLGFKKGQEGIMVNKPYKDDEQYPLKKWDAITRIGNYHIDNDGKIITNKNLHLDFKYMIQHLSGNGKIDLTIIRDGKEIGIDLPVTPERNQLIPYLKDTYPRYFIYGPLVFSPAAKEYVTNLKSGWHSYMIRRGSHLITRLAENTSFEGEELVVVAAIMFPHKITKGYDNPFTIAISKINDIPVKNFQHLVELIRDLKEPFIIFTFAGQQVETMVFRRDEMEAATEKILSDNGIRFQYSEDVAEIWVKSKAHF